jgi:hypothetical protein
LHGRERRRGDEHAEQLGSSRLAGQGRPGEHVQEDRIKDQAFDGVSAEVLYSQSAFGFDAGTTCYRLSSAEAWVSCFQSHNDAPGEWIEYAPSRVLPVGVVL